MALTAAERQRKHRQKLRAEGKLPQRSPKNARVKSKNATSDGQQKWAMRLKDGSQYHGQPKMADAMSGIVVQENFVVNGNLESRSEVVGEAGVDPHNVTEQQLEGNVTDAEGLPQLSNNFIIQPAINDAVSSVGIKQEPVFEMTSNDSTQDLGLNPSNVSSAEQDFISSCNYHSNYLSAEFIIAQERLLRKRQGNAERQRRRRKRMKEEGRYEVYKQKHIVHCEKHRATQREIEKALPETLRREFVAKRREDGRRRVAQYRARKKQIASETQTSLMIEDSLESGSQECSGTSAEELGSHTQQGSVQRRFANWRNKKLMLMNSTDGEMENNFGLSQNFVLWPSESTPQEPNVAAFNPGILPCSLVKSHTASSASSETLSPALFPADKINCSQSAVGRTPSAQVFCSRLTYSDRHEASTSSQAPYVNLPNRTVSSDGNLNTRNTVVEPSQQEEPCSYPAAGVVPRYFTRPPIWPSSRPVTLTESLPQVGILSSSQEYRKLQGNSQITNDQKQTDFSIVEPIEENFTHLQRNPSQTQPQSSQPIITIDPTLDAVSNDNRLHQVPMYDPLDGTADEETPEVLQEDLLKIQSQFPMMHKYVKKLQSDIHKLREAHKKLTKRKMDLTELKTNNDMFKYWTGLPDFSTFEEIFIILKPSLVSTPCQNFIVLTQEEEFFYVLSRIKTGIPVKDIAERIGISEVEFNLIFHRWITALPHKLQYIFKTRDEKARIDAGKPSISYDEVTADYRNVVIDCTDMFSEQVFLNCGETSTEQTELCKFVMGISLPTGTVVNVSDVVSAESGFVLLRLSRGKNDIMVPLGERDSWLVQGQRGHSLVEKILSRVRSLKIVEDGDIKLQCKTFRSMVKVCLLLSNVIRE
ncbi:uncharacterized protein LOC117296860 isoform X1 [Asterias rubens]|uniref:uncharacterized protein LOC117296860 isoform X1 n=1 Tax=Asterias rubens TaxID=7604 RepID=UPI001455CA2F|nr:uncharacterized protein LOC117296860 isoform X1 [Asterias rubens]XP_033635839.1 uncharacterized protein LOC117296860 isoform X1 [Asterias rubens]XP_033635840.1 uncharacterized protein LOC117296860 isoform X1 [Asterias rubens]XP_033635841.1 uncharacterized protein LOC117296860 isoform X1 [Asterias rubens]